MFDWFALRQFVEATRSLRRPRLRRPRGHELGFASLTVAVNVAGIDELMARILRDASYMN
jgi:hypothetical protein